QNLALDIDGDLPGQVAIGYRRGHVRDVAHLAGQVPSHRVHAIGEVLQSGGAATNIGLAAELALGAHLTGHARHLGREAVELVHHAVDGVLQLQDFAPHVDGDLPGQVAVGHGRRHVRDIAHLAGQVTSHRIDAIGEVL